MSPQLAPLPDYQDRVICVGTSVRKPLEILKPFLASLDWQDLPARTKLHYAFVPDFPVQNTDAEAYLRDWVKERGGDIIRGVPGSAGDFSDAANFDSHQWAPSSMARVGQNKTRLIKHTLDIKADAFFYVDADLILDTTTVNSLLACEKPIVTAVYWTHWTKRGYETRQIHAAPQVWLTMPYGLSGRGMDEAEFRSKLIGRELTRVWGFGAATLVSRRVLEAGITFDYLPDVPRDGLMAGEDRHFCIRCERGHIEAYADPFPDIFHIYHPEIHVPQIADMAARLSTVHPSVPALGDLVSVKLEALEPVPHERGWSAIPRQHLRGRIGRLPLMAELEEAVLGMTRGETRVVPVHFPIHYGLQYFRGRRRLIRVTLVDVKAWGHAPVIDAELFVGPKSGRWVDTTTMSAEQMAMLEEVARG